MKLVPNQIFDPHFLASNAKNTIRLKRIKDVLFKLEMSVGNESNYSTFPEC